jgi:hypothetical protein
MRVLILGAEAKRARCNHQRGRACKSLGSLLSGIAQRLSFPVISQAEHFCSGAADHAESPAKGRSYKGHSVKS